MRITSESWCSLCRKMRSAQGCVNEVGVKIARGLLAANASVFPWVWTKPSMAGVWCWRTEDQECSHLGTNMYKTNWDEAVGTVCLELREKYFPKTGMKCLYTWLSRSKGQTSSPGDNTLNLVIFFFIFLFSLWHREWKWADSCKIELY